METVGAYEGKTQLPKLIDRVHRGAHITITKHGVPVAVLQPPDPEKRVDTQSVIAELREFRDRHSLCGLSIRDMTEKGRR